MNEWNCLRSFTEVSASSMWDCFSMRNTPLIGCHSGKAVYTLWLHSAKIYPYRYYAKRKWQSNVYSHNFQLVGTCVCYSQIVFIFFFIFFIVFRIILQWIYTICTIQTKSTYYLFMYVFIWPSPGLSCSTWDLQWSSLQHAHYFFFSCPLSAQHAL